MKTVFIRTPYNYDMAAVSAESGLLCEEETLTQQSFKDECDINTIVDRFGLTGKMPDNVRVPTYGDFSGIYDYQSALAAISSAEESFMAMPHDVRSKFDNDPGLFVDFCSDPANLPSLQELGLALKRTESGLEGPNVDAALSNP